jgi:hypothetical protein
MASSTSGSSGQSQNAAANQSTVTGYGTVTLTVGNFYGLQSWGRVTIGDQSFDVAGPTSMVAGNTWSWSYPRTYTHNANGERGAVGVSVSFRVDGTTLHQSSADAGTQPALNYDRKPAAPTTVTPVLNADRSITVTSNSVSSPASTAQYHISWSQSSNGGSTWGAWSSYEALGSSRTKTYIINALSPGYTYRWRMYASNTDGSSAATNSANLFYPSSGKIYSTSWNQMSTAKRYTGSAWVDLSTAKRYDGSNWVNLG